MWQHSQCLGIRRVEAEKDDFHFVCKDCKRKIEDAKRPNIKLKFRAGLSSSPPQTREKHPTETTSPPTMKFRTVEIPTQQQRAGRPPSQGQLLHPALASLHQLANGVVPSPYLHHATPSSTSIGHSTSRTSQAPNGGPSSSSAHLNGSQQAHAMYPFPLNPPHDKSAVQPAYTNGHAFSPIQTQPHHLADNQPTPGYSNNQSSQHPLHQPQGISQQRHLPMNMTPQTRPNAKQAPNGIYATPSTQYQGRLPSPVLNRPSMSPTQGNPDVGPVAGIPQRSPPGTAMSSSSQVPTNPEQNHLTTAQYNNTHYATTYTNGEHTLQSHNGSTNQHHTHPLSGLSPTKHSPTLPPHTAVPPQSPHLPSSAVNSRQTVSGTPIFPPTEMLQPSPKQLSKSPVPTPSKAMTPAIVGREELRRVGEEVPEEVSGRLGAG